MPVAAPIKTGFRWNEAAQRYVGPSGKFVSNDAVRNALRRFVKRGEGRVARLAADVAEGRLTVAEWERRTADLLKRMHLAGASAAKGGWAQLTPQDTGRVGGQLRFHYERLDRFAREIRAKRLSRRQIIARAKLYARAVTPAYENHRRRAHVGVYAQERRVRQADESCPTCVREAAKGWVATGTLLPLGESECRTGCKCKFEFRFRRTQRENFKG
jgi:hypothetical protein